jgi:hypothetical protein
MILLLKLLLAHLLGDFVFQTDKLARQKEEKKLRSPFLYVHALLHGALTMLLVWDTGFWKYAILITVTHFIIDTAKLYQQQASNRRILFFADQALHVSILLLVWGILQDKPVDVEWLLTDRKLVFYTAFVFLTIPASVIIKIFISAWSPDQHNESSLENAGNWIGILERLLIFGFLIVGKWEAIGFLLAAKSVFRFGDLRDGNDRKLTEYILIGTLASFSIAIVTGLVYLTIQAQW